MEKQEFETIITPQVNNGVGGKVADIFWNHTGIWSGLVCSLKQLLDEMKKFREYEQALEQLKELKRQSGGKVLQAVNEIGCIAMNYRCAKSLQKK